MSCFAITIIVGIIVGVIGIILLLLSIHKSNEGDIQTASFIAGLSEIMVVATLIIITFAFIVVGPAEKSERQQHKMYRKAVESAQNEDIDIYIDGEPVSDNFDINGIDLHDYTIKIENNTLYLISK